MNSQASRVLPIPAGPITLTRRGRRSRAGRRVQVLERAELLVPPDKGRLEGVAPVPAAALRDDAEGAPGGDRGGLPPQGLLARGLEGDRAGCRPPGGLAHQHGPRRRDRLEPGRGVDDVARHHPLVRGPEGDRGLAGQDPGPGRGTGAQRPDRVEELEGGPDGPLGVVLAGHRRAPDGHHRVADELLDGAPVAADHVGGEVEPAGEELADLLGVASLGERREAHEVGEQDADEAALGDRLGSARRRARRARDAGLLRSGRRAPGPRVERRRAPAAELGARRVRWWRTPDTRERAGWRTRCRTARQARCRCRSSSRSRRRWPPGTRSAHRSSRAKDTGRQAGTPASNGPCFRRTAPRLRRADAGENVGHRFRVERGRAAPLRPDSHGVAMATGRVSAA